MCLSQAVRYFPHIGPLKEVPHYALVSKIHYHSPFLKSKRLRTKFRRNLISIGVGLTNKLTMSHELPHLYLFSLFTYQENQSCVLCNQSSHGLTSIRLNLGTKKKRVIVILSRLFKQSNDQRLWLIYKYVLELQYIHFFKDNYKLNKTSESPCL